MTAFLPPLPARNPDYDWYWQSGADGVLRLGSCASCERLLHPSVVVCTGCGGPRGEPVEVSGRGHVWGITTNHQMWHPAFSPPYLIGIIALEEDPRVRLTANVVARDDSFPEQEVSVGTPVEVAFRNVDEVWLPVFTPVAGDHGPALAPLPVVVPSTRATGDRFEDRVAITGLGYSEIGRGLLRPPISLTVDACRAAIADAGLQLEDIDGLSTYPGAGLGGGISEGGISPLVQALGIQPVWHNGAADTPGQCGSVIAGMLAVASGLCQHVLCFRTVWEASSSTLQRNGALSPPPSGRIGGDMQWKLPYGALSASGWIAMFASQYFHQFGGDRTVLGRVAVNARANAGRNERAIYRDPMSLDDYFDARMISSPLGLFDCDVPCDGSVAFVISRREIADDLASTPVLVEAVGTRITEQISWDQGTVTHLPGVFGPASHLWSRTDLTVTDVDVAEIYDGFTFNTVSWIEALGLCGIGEASEFIGDGSRIAMGGDLPMNTHGGQLSAGRTHGYGFLAEGVEQLRGSAGARQVEGAEVALVAVGGGVPGGCFLLRRG